MGSHNGTYVPWHEPVWCHQKTKAACAVLAAAGIPEEYAPALVGRWLHALSCWALRDGDSGVTGRLTDPELAQVAWPEAVSKGRKRPHVLGRLVRDALLAGGLLVDPGHQERIHDFEDHNRGVLYDRRRRRESRRAGGLSGDGSPGSPGTAPVLPGAQSVTSPSLARASGKRQEASGFAGGGDRAPNPPHDGGGARGAGGGRPLSIEEQDRRRQANEAAAALRCSECRAGPREPGRALCASCATPRRAPPPTPPAAT